MARAQAKARRWQEVLRLLEKQHGRVPGSPAPEAADGEAAAPAGSTAPAVVRRRAPLEQLVLSILSEDTSERLALQALRRLQAEFVDLNEVRVSHPRDVAEAIHMVADPNGKAARLGSVLGQLFAKRGSVDLEFLTRLPLDQARAFLEQLTGVDERTRAAVILLALGGDSLPADPAVERVAKRIGLVERGWTTEQVQEALEKAVPPGRRLAFYLALVTHGEKVCLVKTARCEVCALGRACRSRRAGPRRRPPSAARPRPATKRSRTDAGGPSR